MPWAELFKNILGGGGVAPALFLLIVGGLTSAVIVLARAFQKSELTRDTERSNETRNLLAIQEKRLEEGKAMLSALERTATALAAHTLAVESRTQTVSEMVQVLAKVAQTQETTRDHFVRVADRLEEANKTTHNLLRQGR
jgi:hypothetical protein